MRTIGDFDGEFHDRVVAGLVVFGMHVGDVGVGRGDFLGHPGQNPAPIVDQGPDADAEMLVRFRIPFDIHPVVGLLAPRLRNDLAVVGVDHQPLPLADVADDRIAGNRATAGRQLHRHAVGATNGHRRGARFAATVVHAGVQTGGSRQAARNHGRESLAKPDVGVQVLARLGTGIANHAVPVGGIDIALADAECAQGLAQKPLTKADRFLVLDRFHVMADMRPCLAGAYETEPTGIRLRTR